MLLILEFCSRGDLNDFINGRVKAKKPFSDEEILSIIKQITAGLRYCHSLNPPVIHLDLKPGNILIDDDGVIKLADFGFSK